MAGTSSAPRTRWSGSAPASTGRCCPRRTTTRSGCATAASTRRPPPPKSNRATLPASDHYEKWMRNGALDTAARATKIYQDKLASYEPPPLDDAIREELESYVT